MTDALDQLKAALAVRYTIERELGRGGMAVVYLAHDQKLNRPVALKVLRPELAASLGADRFLREIEIAAKLTHPNVLPLHDCGDAGGQLYYTMPFVEGESLRDRLRGKQPLPLDEALLIAREVADGLAHAHSLGVVHRDIKPENILLSGGHAVVADFGVARAVSAAGGTLTATGGAVGTPRYMSPEQASGSEELDARTDIYSLGCVVYEMLVGEPPAMFFDAATMVRGRFTETPPDHRRQLDAIPDHVERALAKALAKHPVDRWQSAEELLPQLEPSVATAPPRTAWGGVWRLAAAMVAALLIVAGFLGSRLLTSRPITVTTSNIRAVTSDPAQDWHPVLSPDGSQVAFASVRDGVWSVVVRSTRDIGTELTLAQGLLPVVGLGWSSDGEFVGFVTFDGSAVRWSGVSRLGGPIRSLDLLDLPEGTWGLSPDTSVALYRAGDSAFSYSIRSRTSTPLFAISSAPHSSVWSPDTRRIAYVDGNSAWLGSFNVLASSIWIVDADGGEPVRVTGEEDMNISPAWLDDDHLLFVSNRDGPREVYVVDVGPTGPRGEPLKVPGIIDPHSISYSVAAGNLAFSKAAARQNIWSYPLGSGTISVTTGRPVTDDNAVNEDNDISPDGRWIAYDQNLRGNMDIYVRPLEGGSPMRITGHPGDEFGPRWSPDGSEIAFYGDNSEGRPIAAVFVVSADGGTPVLIAGGPGFNDEAEWSPSGLEIAFRSTRTGRPEAWLVSRETVGGSWSEPAQLTDFGCSVWDWAPDGSGALCTTVTEDSGLDLVLVSREGEVLWRYAPATHGLRGFGYAEYSRDGSTIYFYGTHGNGLSGIWAIPALGGEPTLVVAFDDPELTSRRMFSVGPDHLYVNVAELETDIWVADVEVGR